jgi:GT2 family glycosyltransferase
VIVSYGRPELLQRCLQSVALHAPELPVHVWDNCSSQTSAVRSLADAWPGVTWTFHPTNIGFAAAVNRLAEHCVGDMLLLNPDAELLAGLEPLVGAFAADQRVACAGPLVEVAGLLPWDNARRSPGLVRMIVEYWGWSSKLRGTMLSQRYRRLPRDVGYVSGACLLVRRRAWIDVGPFDERFWLYSEEVDWARRARRRGWVIRLVPQVLTRHVGGASSIVSPPPGVVESSRDAPPAGVRNWLLDMQVQYLAKHHGRLAARLYLLSVRFHDGLRRSKARIRRG